MTPETRHHFENLLYHLANIDPDHSCQAIDAAFAHYEAVTGETYPRHTSSFGRERIVSEGMLRAFGFDDLQRWLDGK